MVGLGGISAMVDCFREELLEEKHPIYAFFFIPHLVGLPMDTFL
jgi:hypothetical protein